MGVVGVQPVSHPDSFSAGVLLGAHIGDGGLGWAPVGAVGGTRVSWPVFLLCQLSAAGAGDTPASWVTCFFAQLPGSSFIRNHYGLVALKGAPTHWKWGPFCG